MSDNDYLKEPEMQQALSNMNSLEVVEKILDQTVLQKVAEHAYNKYLTPKVRPFCACSTVATMAEQVNVRIK